MMQALSIVALIWVIGAGGAWAIYITDVRTERTTIANYKEQLEAAYKQVDDITKRKEALLRQAALKQCPPSPPQRECPAPVKLECPSLPPTKPQIIRTSCPKPVPMTGVCKLLECDTP